MKKRYDFSKSVKNPYSRKRTKQPAKVSEKRDIGREILEGIREIKRGKRRRRSRP